MPVFTRKQFNDYLHGSKIDESNQVYLVYGDRLLANQILKSILNIVLPQSIDKFNTETFDGSNTKEINQLVNSINTFSLSQNGKLVVLYGLKMVQSRESSVQNQIKRRTEKVCKSNTISGRKHETKKPHNKKTNVQSNSLLVETVIKEGILNGHYLILLSDTVDKNTSLFKTVSDRGIIIDCFIPDNRTRSNQELKKSLLYELMDKILAENKKTIDKKAYEILYNITDFNLDVFSKNFISLVDYVGERNHIKVADVKKLLEKTKKDPIFVLTNAVIRQDLVGSLSCLNSLLLDNVHPLQILTSISNKIRRLILAKNFIFHDKNQIWKNNQTFTDFKINTLDSIIMYDEHTKDNLNEGEKVLESTKESLGYVSNLALSRNRNPYAVYVTMLEADKLRKNFLFNTIKVLREADKKLRLSSANPKSILESVIFSICNFFKTQENA